jgi:uncharacterized protein with NRDE domain
MAGRRGQGAICKRPMCVVALALDCHPHWRLLLSGNRDEYHARASAPLARWGDAPHVLGGRDLVSGGGWLGVSEEGRMAVVTNIRSLDGPDPNKASRGALVSDWLLAGVLPPKEMLDGYNGFSLIAAGGREAGLLANRPAATHAQLGQGVHSLSNGVPGDAWPRRERLSDALSVWLSGKADDPATLFTLLRPEGEANQAPMFINAPVYGTRCSTVIAVDHVGHGWISERRFDQGGGMSGETTLDFRWPV